MNDKLCPGLELPDTLGLNLPRIVSKAKLTRNDERVLRRDNSSCYDRPISFPAALGTLDYVSINNWRETNAQNSQKHIEIKRYLLE